MIRWLIHALELDHSPSLSGLGRCPCKSCLRTMKEWHDRGIHTAADAFEAGLRSAQPTGEKAP